MHNPPVPILAADETFHPFSERTLPPLEDARRGVLTKSPILLRERMDRYFDMVCRTHYHVGLVRIVDGLVDLEGIVLVGPTQSTGMTLKAHIGELVAKPGLAGSRARVKAEKALQALRAGLPRDTRSIELLLGFSALAPGEKFLLTRGTAATYLAQLSRRDPDLSTWLAQSQVSDTLGQAVPDAPVTPARPRM